MAKNDPPTSAPGFKTQPSHYGDQYPAITEVLHRYCEGLYYSDTAQLRLAFRPQADYATASGGELLH